jgi:hypothetical protein
MRMAAQLSTCMVLGNRDETSASVCDLGSHDTAVNVEGSSPSSSSHLVAAKYRCTMFFIRSGAEPNIFGANAQPPVRKL